MRSPFVVFRAYVSISVLTTTRTSSVICSAGFANATFPKGEGLGSAGDQEIAPTVIAQHTRAIGNRPYGSGAAHTGDWKSPLRKNAVAVQAQQRR